MWFLLVSNLVLINYSSAVLTLADRWFRYLPVLQLVVNADHQHVIPRNQTEVHTYIVFSSVSGGSGAPTL